MNLERAEALVIHKMEIHGLCGWEFSYNNTKRSYGQCDYMKKTIYLSKVLTKIVNEEHVLDTVLHEIAHALVGPGHGHSSVWKDMAILIGCRANATSDLHISDEDLPPKWVMIFNGDIVKRYMRKPNKNTFRDLKYLELRGQPESLGKLELIEYKAYNKV